MPGGEPAGMEGPESPRLQRRGLSGCDLRPRQRQRMGRTPTPRCLPDEVGRDGRVRRDRPAPERADAENSLQRPLSDSSALTRTQVSRTL